MAAAAPPKRNDSRALVIAGGLGLLAALLVVVFLRNSAGDGGTTAPPSGQVVVAKQDLQSGSPVTAEMVELKAVPEAGIAPGAYRDLQSVVNSTVRYPIVKGEQVTQSRIVTTERPSEAFSFQIPAGMRAMTIPVSINNTPAALIAPGDFVDVLLTIETTFFFGAPRPGATPTQTEERKGTAVLMQNVQVVSVDRSYADVPYDPSVRGQPPEDRQRVSFVTLAVRPDQTQLLFLAQTEGTLTLVLRGFGDEQILSLPPLLEPLCSLPGNTGLGPCP